MTATVVPFPADPKTGGVCRVCGGVKRVRVTSPGFPGGFVIPCPKCRALGARLLLSLIDGPAGGVS
jgi:hypothetical protein